MSEIVRYSPSTHSFTPRGPDTKPAVPERQSKEGIFPSVTEQPEAPKVLYVPKP